MNPSFEFFYGRTLVIATKHEKEKVIAPILERELGVKCILPPHLDTDRFGTFSGEIKRKGNMLQAAREKALAACNMVNCDLAIASEGSFGPHPSAFFINSNFELTLLVDRANDLEIRGHYRTEDTNFAGEYVDSAEKALDVAKKWGFPEHGILLKKKENSTFFLHKEIQTEKELLKISRFLLRLPFIHQLYLETDMRAHRNPKRMTAIEQSCLNLLQNVFGICPKCYVPGFCVVEVEKGLLCENCHLRTDLPKYDVYVCQKCKYQEKRRNESYGDKANFMYCDYCNP